MSGRAEKALRGLYLITDEQPFAALLPKLEAALDQGIALLQYRRKLAPPGQRDHEARVVAELCQRYQTPLIINDDIELASRLQAGVHLGQQDGSVAAARTILGAAAIIGATCHGESQLIQQAAGQGASYVAIGAIYPSATKPQAGTIRLRQVRELTLQSSVPVCAIGGLNLDNAAPVIECGVSLIAVISDICQLEADQISYRIAQWQRLMENLS